LARSDARVTVVVFLGTTCPISCRYVPALNEIASKNQAADFFAVISDPTITRKEVAAFRDEYKLSWPVIVDGSGILAGEFKPTATPEVFVLDRHGELQYRGKIDDGYVDLGKPSQVVKSHDLIDALAAVLEGRPVAVAKTQPVGCTFEAWDKHDLSGKITYARDIAPILNANCASCHRAGDIAPFPLTSFSDAAKHADLISSVTSSHYMPPWKPAEKFGHFVGEQRLTDREIELLTEWAQSGAPQGDAADLPTPPTFSSDWAHGTPDLVVKMPEPFTVPAAGRDQYRAFVVPLNLPAGSFVAGIEFHPGAKSVVHHCLLYLDSNGEARKLDEKDPAPGYETFGGVGFTPSGSLGGWAPGATPPLLPAGVARVVPGNCDLVIQMHYHPDGHERVDQSSVAIYLQKPPIQKVMASIALGTRQIDIPAGEADYQRVVTLTLPTDVTLLGAIPHMHLLGREMKVQATTPDGKEVPLIWIKDWDFKWQGQYQFADRITLPKGTKIQMTARYDNSAANPNNPSDPPKRITRGEQTTDEMCLCFLSFLADSPRQAQTMRVEMERQLVTEAVTRRLTGQ
jgi:mono/diheme cytochrome c family protein